MTSRRAFAEAYRGFVSANSYSSSFETYELNASGSSGVDFSLPDRVAAPALAPAPVPARVPAPVPAPVTFSLARTSEALSTFSS